MRTFGLVAVVVVASACGSVAPATELPPPQPSTCTTPGPLATGCGALEPDPPAPTASARPSPSPSEQPSGCGVLPPSPTTPIPSEGCGAALALPDPGEAVPPGRYFKRGFEPRVVFSVGPGWTAEQSTEGFFDIQDEPGSLDVVAVQFATAAAGSVGAALTEVENGDGLVVSEPESVSVGGHAATRVLVETTDPADLEPPVFHAVMTITPGPVSIASGRRLQVTLLQIDGEVLCIFLGGSVAEWDYALAIGAPVVESVTIEQ